MDAKPDYRSIIETAIRAANAAADNPDQIAMSEEAVQKMANSIVRALRDAGFVLALDNGTDYAHRT